MSKNPPKISLIDLFLEGPMADLLRKKDGYKQIDNTLLHNLTKEILDLQATFNWNAYNDVKIRNSDPATTTGFEPQRPFPPYPRPYSSWLEFSEQYFGGLKDLEREPEAYVIPYFTEHTYKPDNILEEENDRIIFEIKGAIRSLEEAAKYRNISQQYDIHFIFVLQCHDIKCPWATERKDGSRMTHEEWCVRNNFDYCYHGQVEEFRASARFKSLVENVGKGKISFKEELVLKRKRIEQRRSAAKLV